MAWNSPGEFYSAVYDRAISLGANDVQARLAAAQASQETGFGQHYVGNNLFGIKAGSDYVGDVVNAGTNEEYNGQNVRENANFRAYDDPLASVGGYLATIQQNFPDAWNAPTFSDAVQGLKTGVFGSYATDSQYGNRVAAIDNALGGYAFASNPTGIPTPYGPNDVAPDYAAADDVLPMTQPNFTAANPEFAFAANPSNIPAPEARPQQPGLLSAYAEPAQAQASPFDAVTSQSKEWGVINGVGPVYTPTFNQWDAMASAAPVSAPMGSVTASGLLGPATGLEASATAGLLASPSSRMGLAEPSFDMSRFDGAAPSVASGFDQGRFASPETAAFDASRFGGGLLNPATNTASFMDQPADLGSMPDAYAAQRGPSTGMLSADFQTIQGLAEKQLAENANTGLLSPSVASAYAAEPSVTPAQQAIAEQTSATGLLGANPGLAASATVPSIAGTMTPSQIAGYQQMAASAPNITNLSGYTGIFDDGTGYQNAAPAAAQVPDLQQVDITNQPSVATVDGPATTPALEQQAQQDQQQAITAPTTTASTTAQTEQAPSSLGSKLSKAINPGTIGGGLLGGLALGPAGGLVGGLLGNAAYNGGLFGASQPMAINNIGGGLMNTASIWGGGTPAGTQATASDGQTITSMGNGYTALTNSYGTTTVFDQSGKAMSYFGGALGNDDAEAQSSNSGGGFFGGLFG